MILNKIKNRILISNGATQSLFAIAKEFNEFSILQAVINTIIYIIKIKKINAYRNNRKQLNNLAVKMLNLT
ncbi:hypothetical protein SAMN02583745_00703 [Thorsellia anophelis DSM 18579]|uniref:Uncharacterized protein n=1 Tax=Thorsellia anophelis DSM 18579 TaxID=1123402 RepID=A0A1H9ZU88_9GAMM|nr:hypothetical protein SAMN02583745_00703 [Thorsellia anophelis DSM 18579]